MLTLPPSYKAIVLFTPGGDLVYSIDPSRRQHWHLDLCIAVQEIWHLSEPPHFLVPLYTATIDYHWDPETHSSRIYAEAYPPSFPYRHLLNALFRLSSPPWRCLEAPQGQEDVGVFYAYHRQFPQLWQRQDWVLNLNQIAQVRSSLAQPHLGTALSTPWLPSTAPSSPHRPDTPPVSETLALGIPAVETSPSEPPTPQTPNPGPSSHSPAPTNPQPNQPPTPPATPSATRLPLTEADRDRGYVLRLFVAGHGSSTLMILQRLYSLLESHVAVPYTLKVVDIVKYPDQAESNQVKAVPTLIRVWPEPTYRVVGYFERWEQLAQLFD